MGGDHGHGLGERAKVPDYSIYKVENHPELIEHREKLARIGLKDPWIRNEAWRYNQKEWGTLWERRLLTFRGFKWGLLAALVTVGIQKGLSYGKEDEHAHH